MRRELLRKDLWRPLGIMLLWLSSQMVAYGQSVTVSGTITDAGDKSPLVGVNVLEGGTTNGTITDVNGNYTLSVSGPNALLVISYVGYETQEVRVGNSTTFNFELSEDIQALQEVVVIGYGEAKKTDLTGSIASADATTITERGTTNALEGIQGNVPGVQVASNTGRLGDSFNVTIRGKNSMNDDSAPLYIVDGTPTAGIDYLNPQDIYRIDVLKDASSAAIYGSRGSNGVVIVTTKSGRNADPGLNISLNTYVGLKKPARLPDMMDGEKWWYYHNSAYLATAATDPVTGTVTEQTLHDAVIGSSNSLLEQRAENNETFDWYDAVLKNGIQTNTYLSINGRGESGVNYNIGVGYQKETGNINNEELEKYTLKAGVDHNISEKFRAGINLTVTNVLNQQGSDLAMQEAFRLNPFLSPYGLDGELFPQPGKLVDENGDFLINKTSTYNPILEINNTVDEIRRWTTIGNVYLQYMPLDWLSFRSSFSTSLDQLRRGQAWGAQTNTGISNNNLASAELSNAENFNYTWDNQMNIDFDLNNEHTFNFMALQSIYLDRFESSFLSSRDMPFYTSFYNIGSGAQSTYNLGSNYIKQTLASFALRLNYIFRDKYLVTISNRWDGSSLLSDDNKWASFPSAAVAWRVSQEPFLQDASWLSDLKFRVSYGYTGNNIISPYSTLSQLTDQVYYDFNGSAAVGWLPGSLANSALAWEKTREFNIGLDYGFLDNRIYGTLDIYDRLSDDLLMEQRLPAESGWESINANVGSVRNKGIELGLTTRNIQNSKLSWETTFTFTKNTNSIESLYGQDEANDVGNGWFIGESIDAQYNYVFDGIWQANESDEAISYGQTEGQAKVRDLNNDGVIDPDDDRRILGSADPKWSGGILSRLVFGNFDLVASLVTAQGIYVYSPFHANFTDTRDRGRQKLDIDWYVPANDAGVEPQYSNNYPQPRNMGTYWRNDGVGYYKDASYTKIKNITLGYTLGPDVLDKISINDVRIYVNVLNPFVFTNYDGYDPEWAGADLGIGRVSSIVYQFGLNVNF